MHNIRAVLEHGFRAAFCCFCVNGMDFDQVTVKVVNSKRESKSKEREIVPSFY